MPQLKLSELPFQPLQGVSDAQVQAANKMRELIQAGKVFVEMPERSSTTQRREGYSMPGAVGETLTISGVAPEQYDALKNMVLQICERGSRHAEKGPRFETQDDKLIVRATVPQGIIMPLAHQCGLADRQSLGLAG